MMYILKVFVYVYYALIYVFIILWGNWDIYKYIIVYYYFYIVVFYVVNWLKVKKIFIVIKGDIKDIS